MAAGTLDPNAAFKRYFSDPDWGAKTATGASFNAIAILLVMLHSLLLPVSVLLWSVVCGYMLKVMRSEPSGKLPEWSEWSETAISGMTWFAAATGFFLIVLSAFTVSFMVGIGRGWLSAHSTKFLPWSISTFALLFLLTLFISLLTAFLQVNMAQEERMPAAFAVRKVLTRFRRRGREMFVAWLLAVGLNFVAVLIPMCTILGAFLVPASSFMASAISATILAQAYNDE
ncbi:MAG TPA: DUF4013 domain-containing protein [Planktothrix sp.]|jgi:fumarate reductase subunit D